MSTDMTDRRIEVLVSLRAEKQQRIAEKVTGTKIILGGMHIAMILFSWTLTRPAQIMKYLQDVSTLLSIYLLISKLNTNERI